MHDDFVRQSAYLGNRLSLPFCTFISFFYALCFLSSSSSLYTRYPSLVFYQCPSPLTASAKSSQQSSHLITCQVKPRLPFDPPSRSTPCRLTSRRRFPPTSSPHPSARLLNSLLVNPTRLISSTTPLTVLSFSAGSHPVHCSLPPPTPSNASFISFRRSSSTMINSRATTDESRLSRFPGCGLFARTTMSLAPSSTSWRWSRAGSLRTSDFKNSRPRPSGENGKCLKQLSRRDRLSVRHSAGDLIADS